jgi:hypothetical protein
MRQDHGPVPYPIFLTVAQEFFKNPMPANSLKLPANYLLI